jgi:hypothetical protein
MSTRDFSARSIPQIISIGLCLLSIIVFSLIALTPSAVAQGASPVYDNFNQKFLDPTKWATSSPCFTWTVLECVREIQDGQLRLAVRGYGAVDSNQGSQYGESELHFIDPTPIRSIASQLVIRRTSALGCAANPEGAHAHALIQGTFFNSGSGDPTDDVQGLLIFDRYSSDPVGVASAEAFLHWQGQFFGFVDLGTVNVGQRVIAQLTWDQRNHRFVASWTDVATGNVTRASIPYTMSDTMAAAAPDKLLGVRTFTPNCVGRSMLFVDMEALFDNVVVR